MAYIIYFASFPIAWLFVRRFLKRATKDSEFRQLAATFGLWIALCYTLAFSCDALISRFGSTIPGAFFEKYEYQEWFYVNLFPENAHAKNYRVPALIEKGGREYFLRLAIFPNGGVVRFQEDDIFDLERVDQKRDDNGRTWKVEFLHKKAPPPINAETLAKW